jgi:peroxiredoxin
MPEVGEKAPLFELAATGAREDTLALEDVAAGSNVLVAFYPFDWSPVCTNELGFLNTNREAFAEQGTSIVAISVDSPFSHEAWAKAEGLEIPLLSDFNKEVCQAYGAFHAELLGLKGFAKRAVFLVDRDLVVRYRWVSDDPGVEPDYEAILAAAAALD